MQGKQSLVIIFVNYVNYLINQIAKMFQRTYLDTIVSLTNWLKEGNITYVETWNRSRVSIPAELKYAKLLRTFYHISLRIV